PKPSIPTAPASCASWTSTMSPAWSSSPYTATSRQSEPDTLGFPQERTLRMDRHTRKELKTDKFAQGVGSGFEFVAHHRGQMLRYTLIGLAVVVVIAGVWAYRSHQATARADLLTKAMQIDEATIGAAQPPRMSFPTIADKEKARIAAFTDVATKYPGSQEGAIAQLAVAAAQADEGKIDDAVKTFQAVSDNAPAPYASVAQL